jgi:translation initiation factor 2B subunit (eIF-2B alpha/beta/delta family)
MDGETNLVAVAASGSDKAIRGTYKSPRRVLTRFFRLSRDRWKEKHRALKKTLKRAENRVRDTRKSREAWREAANRWKAEAEASRAEVARLEKELAEARQEAGKKGARNAPPRRRPAGARPR